MPYNSTREVVDALREGTDEDRAQILDALEGEEVGEGITALDVLRYDWSAWGRDEQLMPGPDVLWRFLALRAGRGGGKTRAGGEATNEAGQNPDSCGGKICLIAPTHGDIRITMVEGESGVLACAPPWAMPQWQPGYGHGGRLRWAGAPVAAGHSTGAGDTCEALCFSAEKPGRIRGPQFGFAWGDEFAEWGTRGQQVHDLLNPALRLGRMPRAVYTSTPKPTPFVEFLDGEATREQEEIADGDRDPRNRSYIQRIWSTFANADNLPAATIEELQRRYGNTTQGRQELLAELLLDDPDALWSYGLIASGKVLPSQVPELELVAVGVDNATTTSPPGLIDDSTIAGRNKDVGSNDTGIVTAGLGVDGHIYIWRDDTLNASPAKWGKRVIEVFADAWPGRRANYIVCEKNAGYDLIKRNLDVCLRDEGINPALVPIRYVTARDGKDARAEPIHALYEQKRIHHVQWPAGAPGSIAPLADLEYQQTRFRRGRTGYKKDRVDAEVWAVTSLISGPTPGGRAKRAKKRLATYVS